MMKNRVKLYAVILLLFSISTFGATTPAPGGRINYNGSNTSKISENVLKDLPIIIVNKEILIDKYGIDYSDSYSKAVIKLSADKVDPKQLIDFSYVLSGKFYYMEKGENNKLSSEKVKPFELRISYNSKSKYNLFSLLQIPNTYKISKIEIESCSYYSGFGNGYNSYLNENNEVETEVIVPYSNTPPISAVTPTISFEYYIENKRYNTDLGSVTMATPTYDGTTNSLTFNWTSQPNAEEYDLEWTFVNAYSDGALTTALSPSQIEVDPLILDKNSTRVTVSGNSYSIPVLFNNGYIIYRVRPVGRRVDSDGIKTTVGKWNNAIPTPSGGLLSNFFSRRKTITLDKLSSDMYYSLIGKAHHEELNWQYTTNYAEEGKSKLSMTYADGSMRARQAQTLVSTDANNKNLVVGETVYDAEGRAAVQVLPVPVEGERKVDFKPAFNKNTSGKAYSWEDFDKDKATVSDDAVLDRYAAPLDSTSGASYFYSKNNTSAKAAYIPTAQGYPMTQVEYTPDNTGRVQAQSGVGPEFQVNYGKRNEHTTRYYYGTPSQQDLDQLFGNEVGYCQFYKKNMVKDPNNQVSISYLDPAGKVIATALSGNSPMNLDAIPLKNPNQERYESLIQKTASAPRGMNNELDLRNATIKMGKQILVAQDNDKRTFDYSVEHKVYTDALKDYNCDGEIVDSPIQKCYDCVLDVDISLTDQYNKEYLKRATTVGATTSAPVEGDILDKVLNKTYFDTPHCGAPVKDSYVILKDQKLNDGAGNEKTLSVGKYSLSKVLKVNDKALNAYMTDYLTNNKAIKTLACFEKESLHEIDFTTCMSCSTCDKLIDYSSFEKLPTDYKYPDNPDCSICFKDTSEFNTFKRFCASDKCKGTGCVTCDAPFDAMLMDMSEGGQYGYAYPGAEILDKETGDVSASDRTAGTQAENDLLSIFNENNVLPIKTKNINGIPTDLNPSWRNPVNLRNAADPKHYFANFDATEIDYVKIKKISEEIYMPAIKDKNQLKHLSGNVYLIEPQYLSDLGVFLEHMKMNPYWAHSLVVYHPEYEYFEFCSKISDSHNWDEELRYIETFDALTKFNPDISSSLSNEKTDILNVDPYFRNNAFRTNMMLGGMNNYAAKPGGGFYTIWDAIRKALQSTVSPNCSPQRNVDYLFSEENKDEAWKIFKSMYAGIKQKIVDMESQQFAIAREGYCGCVGDNGFISSEDGFDSNFYKSELEKVVTYTVVDRRDRWDKLFGRKRSSTVENVKYNIKNIFQDNNPKQPCNNDRAYLYKDKTPRFGKPSEMLNMGLPSVGIPTDITNAGDYESVSQLMTLSIPDPNIMAKYAKEGKNKAQKNQFDLCGQCPLAFNLQQFVSELVSSNHLRAGNTVNVTCDMTTFVAELEAQLVGTGATTATISSNSSQRSVSITLKKAVSGQIQGIYLFFPQDAWDKLNGDVSNILHICCLNYLKQINSTDYEGLSFVENKNFAIKATGKDTKNNNVNFDFIIQAYSDYNIGQCPFEKEYEIAPIATNSVNTFNGLLKAEDPSNSSNRLFTPTLSAPYYSVDGVNYEAYMTLLTTDIVDSIIKVKSPNAVSSEKWEWTATRNSKQIVGVLQNLDNNLLKCTYIFTLPSGYENANIVSFLSPIKPDKTNPFGCNLSAKISYYDASISRIVTKVVTVNCKNDCYRMSVVKADKLEEDNKYKNCVLTEDADIFLDYLNTNKPSVNEFKFSLKGKEYPVSISIFGGSKYSLADIKSGTFSGLEQIFSEGVTFYRVKAKSLNNENIVLVGMIGASSTTPAFSLANCSEKIKSDCELPDDSKKLQVLLSKAAKDKVLNFSVLTDYDIKLQYLSVSSTDPTKYKFDCESLKLYLPQGVSVKSTDSITDFYDLNPAPKQIQNCSDTNDSIADAVSFSVQGNTGFPEKSTEALYVRTAGRGDCRSYIKFKTENLKKAGDVVLELTNINVEADHKNQLNLYYIDNEKWNSNEANINNQPMGNLVYIGTASTPAVEGSKFRFVVPSTYIERSNRYISFVLLNPDTKEAITIDNLDFPPVIKYSSPKPLMPNPFTITAKIAGKEIVLTGSSDCYETPACDACKCIGANLINNGDFELPQTFTNGSAIKTETSPANSYLYVRTPSYVSSSLPSGTYYPLAWSQKISGLIPGQEYVFSFDKAMSEGECRYTIGMVDPSKVDNDKYLLVNNKNLILANQLYRMQDGKTDYTNSKGEIVVSEDGVLIRYSCTIIPTKETELLFLADGARTEATFFYLDNFTLQKKSCTEGLSPLCESKIFPEITFDETAACSNLKKAEADYKANFKYEAYINETKAAFRNNYIKHCLDVNEDFNMRYTDFEHHFTLYYYDQAGNLVRTIPPEGVSVITDPALLAQIKVDRDKGTRSVFTNHSMATTYAYNSLGQLTNMGMLDHNSLNIIKPVAAEQTTAANYSAESTQYFDDKNGVMSVVDPTNTKTPAKMYFTNDAGKTWKEITIAGVADLNDAFSATEKISYIVGNAGAFIKVLDEKAEMGTLPTRNDLVQVYFSSPSNGIVFDKSGNSWSTTNYGTDWSNLNSSLSALIREVSSAVLKDVDFIDEYNAMAVSSDGRIFKSTNKGVSWTEVTNIQAQTLNQVLYANKTYYAFGVEGGIYKRMTGSKGSRWNKIPCLLAGNIISALVDAKLAFVCVQNDGVYTNDDFENSPNKWTKVNVGELTGIVQVYKAANKYYALGANGCVELNTANPVLIDYKQADNPYSVSDMQYVSVSSTSTATPPVITTNEYLYIAQGEDLYMIKNNMPQTVGLPPKINADGTLISKIHFVNEKNAVAIKGGKLYLWNNNADAWQLANTSKIDYEDFSFTSDNLGYVLRDNGIVEKIEYNTTDNEFVLSDIEASSFPTAGANSFNSIKMLERSSDHSVSSGIMIGVDGAIWYSTDGAIWQPETQNVVVGGLNSIDFMDANRAVAVGVNGSILTSSNRGSQWVVTSSGTTSTLNFVENNQIVGDNGTILTYQAGNWVSEAIAGVTSKLMGVNYSVEGSFAVAADGLILIKPTGTTSWSTLNLNSTDTGSSFISIGNFAAGKAIAVAKNGRIYLLNIVQ